MTKWKWWLGAHLKSKIFILNENGDFFWLDWARRRTYHRVRRVSGRPHRRGRRSRSGPILAVPVDARVPDPLRWHSTFAKKVFDKL